MGEGYGALFESKGAKGRMVYKVYAGSVFVGLCLIWVYRATHIPRASEEGRWAWMGMFGAELFCGLYWLFTQSVRLDPIYHSTFKDKLLQRYGDQLPLVDVFVCTADPTIEPPMLVINTVLSVMAFDYPPEKLSIYLSDDGGSELTFYALSEAASFSKYWIPFCRRFKVEPRAPAAYFSLTSEIHDPPHYDKELVAIKKLYREMENRIETIVKLGSIPRELSIQHKGFSEWSSQTTSGNHQAMVQILIDGRDPNSVDIEGTTLPTLVYLAREKQPQYAHNFKAGAMNALIRVSSVISNGPIILNVDCDMYSNNSESVRDALCFFMDEENGHEIAFVQFPQNFNNITEKNTYGEYIGVVNEVELHGFGEAALYIGTGCFHRRESLCGRQYDKDFRENWNIGNKRTLQESTSKLAERAKSPASCTYEQNTQWGTSMGVMYGCPVEDIITGLSIQCRGWKSIYFNPKRKGFLGMAATTLGQLLVQHSRWSEGLFQIFLSKYCPFLYGHGKIKLGFQMAYSIYLLWAPLSLTIVYYVTIPSLCLLKGIPLFPKISSLWFIPFAYVITITHTYSLGEALWCGEPLKSCWNIQRAWMIRKTTSHLFGFINTISKLLGFRKLAFTVTSKVADQEVQKRYEQGIMEFGSSTPMFTVLATLALLNLLCLVGGLKRIVVDEGVRILEQLLLQLLLCGLLVIINIPIYQGLFLRTDKGRLPTSLAFESVLLASLACLVSML